MRDEGGGMKDENKSSPAHPLSFIPGVGAMSSVEVGIMVTEGRGTRDEPGPNNQWKCGSVGAKIESLSRTEG
jgi:hypothetical protein